MAGILTGRLRVLEKDGGDKRTSAGIREEDERLPESLLSLPL